ncbi:MAG: M48 family metallopeptidase [Planctomycetota bacterium]
MFRLALIPLLALCLAALGCTTNKATGDSHLNLLSPEQERAMGEEFAAEIRNSQPVLESGSITRAVERVGNKLAAESEEPDLPWEFVVIDQPTINAFALPGGKVFIYRGLLAEMTNEAQLAAVLGHEIGHVTAEHHDRRYQSQVGVGVLVSAIGIAGGVSGSEWGQYAGVAASAGGGLAIAKWGRDDESQSDELGLRYMTRAGYNPQGMVELMQILDRASGGGGIEWTQTHPLPATRIDRTSRIIDREYQADLDLPFYESRFERQVAGPIQELAASPQLDGNAALAQLRSGASPHHCATCYQMSRLTP